MFSPVGYSTIKIAPPLIVQPRADPGRLQRAGGGVPGNRGREKISALSAMSKAEYPISQGRALRRSLEIGTRPPGRTELGLRFAPALYLCIAAAGWSRQPVQDETRYLGFADNLAHGFYSPPGAIQLWSSPGYPLLLAPFRAVGFGPGALRLLNAPLLLAAVWCFFRFLRNHLPDRAALLGAGALGLYFPVWKFLPVADDRSRWRCAWSACCCGPGPKSSGASASPGPGLRRRESPSPGSP